MIARKDVNAVLSWWIAIGTEEASVVLDGHLESSRFGKGGVGCRCDQ